MGIDFGSQCSFDAGMDKRYTFCWIPTRKKHSSGANNAYHRVEWLVSLR